MQTYDGVVTDELQGRNIAALTNVSSTYYQL